MVRLCPLLALVFLLVVGGFKNARAQFNIVESFRTSEVNELIILGGYDEELGSTGAILTAAKGIDEPNEGWLRLTDNRNDQRGFAYIDKSFPSTLGVQIELEYKMYRPGASDGADGFTVFLFDGEVGEPGNPFQIGGYGGALGYNQDNGDGLKGGYLGIGFDVYGNYSDDNQKKNHVVIRGPETRTYSQIIYKRVPSGFNLDIGNQNTRPSDDEFYRKVQVRIEPNNAGRYHVWVGWMTDPAHTNYTTLLETTIDDVPFETLKVGFAASTGGSVNYHEIRDVVATTPGNLRVSSRALQEEIVLRGENTDGRNEFQFAIDVHNETKARLNQIQVTHAFKDIQGLLEEGSIELTGIQATGFLHHTLPSLQEIADTVEFSGNVALRAESTGTILLSGTLLKPLRGGRLISEASVETDQIEDLDLENNFSSASSLITVEGVDLAVRFDEPDYCLNENHNVAFVIENLGDTRADYEFNNNPHYDEKEILLEFWTDPEVELNIKSSADWKAIGSQDGIHRFILAREEGGKNNLHIPPRTALAPFRFSFDSENLDEIGIYARVTYAYPSVTEVDRTNNEATVIVTRQVPPEVVLPRLGAEIMYCLGEKATPLEAIASHDNELNWYDVEGVPLFGAPTPETSVAGITTYFVTQTNGFCESEPTEITIVVLGPDAGTITAPAELCIGSRPTITGDSPAPDLEDIAITYTWERSNDGYTWEVISGAEEASLEPDRGIFEDVFFRRWTIYNHQGKDCRSLEAATLGLQPKACKIMVNPALPSHAYPF